MNKWLKIILVLFVLGVLGGIGVYIFVYNKPHTDYAKAKPEIIAEARACYDEFVSDRFQAEQKYNGKIVQLYGTFSRVEKNDSLTVLVFVFNEGVFGEEGIRCTMLPSISYESLEQQIGNQIVVKGFLTGYNETDVIMENCSIVEP